MLPSQTDRNHCTTHRRHATLRGGAPLQKKVPFHIRCWRFLSTQVPRKYPASTPHKREGARAPGVHEKRPPKRKYMHMCGREGFEGAAKARRQPSCRKNESTPPNARLCGALSQSPHLGPMLILERTVHKSSCKPAGLGEANVDPAWRQRTVNDFGKSTDRNAKRQNPCARPRKQNGVQTPMWLRSAGRHRLRNGAEF